VQDHEEDGVAVVAPVDQHVEPLLRDMLALRVAVLDEGDAGGEGELEAERLVWLFNVPYIINSNFLLHHRIHRSSTCRYRWYP